MIAIACPPAAARRLRLSKHHLTGPAERVDLAALSADLVGFHATNPISPYLQAFARLSGFRRQDLESGLYEERTLVRVRAMRGTLFIMSRDLAAVAIAATRGIVEPLERRILAGAGVTLSEYERTAEAIEAALAGSPEPLSAAELRSRIGIAGTLAGVLTLMCGQGRLARDRPVGSWRSNAFAYRLAADVMPDVLAAIEALPRADAIRSLVARYVERYGPVSARDVAWFTGLPLRDVRPALAELGRQLVEVDVEGWRERCVAFAADAERLAGLDEPAPDVFLPMLDPYTMNVADKSVVLDPRWRDLAMDRAGNVAATVVVDGSIAGVWDVVERPAGRVLVHLFGPEPGLPETVERRADAIGRFWFGRPVPVEAVAEMRPIAGRDAGAVLAPLR